MAQSAKTRPAAPKSKAEARFRELVDELKLLTVAFPHLREAFDPEELPVSFLLRRGADRAAARARGSRKAAVKPAAPARKRAK
jgi:hypothetical protein